MKVLKTLIIFALFVNIAYGADEMPTMPTFDIVETETTTGELSTEDSITEENMFVEDSFSEEEILGIEDISEDTANLEETYVEDTTNSDLQEDIDMSYEEEAGIDLNAAANDANTLPQTGPAEVLLFALSLLVAFFILRRKSLKV